ncbi:MAG TPA: non-homologous end-joining DNA ligase [Nocardioidaceae bacterium]|nr:non-homologous end-joining DNA ligase [Nocardioidaceae bacterium]
MRPMLATKGSRVPSGEEWLHEVKWDGVRVLVEVRPSGVRLWSRNENDVSVAYPELQGLSGLRHEVLLDGEVVALADGVPRFSAIADRMHVRNARRADQLAGVNPVTLIAFDLLQVDGRDVMGRALTERRSRLEGLGVQGPSWQVPATYDDGAMLHEATEQQGLEGVVSKKRASVYVPGRRSPDWLKFPHRPTGSYVVGGWRLETDSESRLGAVLVGVPTEGGLSYRGRVGSGLTGKVAERLAGLLAPLSVDASPFCDEVPRVDAKGTTWVGPEVVVEIASLGTTPGLRLRQPSFRGIRADLRAGDLEGADG